MDFARQQRDPTRHVIGIAFVILFHILVIYSLLTGLGSTAGQRIKKPLPAPIIEAPKAPAPPPPLPCPLASFHLVPTFCPWPSFASCRALPVVGFCLSMSLFL